MQFTDSDIQRFEQKVGEPNEVTGCQIWQGCYQSTGYGYFRVGESLITAHRASYIINVGPIPEGHLIHHRCEVKACTSPSHLQAVTRKEHAAIHYGE